VRYFRIERGSAIETAAWSQPDAAESQALREFTASTTYEDGTGYVIAGRRGGPQWRILALRDGLLAGAT
jgi:hypothetical protein